MAWKGTPNTTEACPAVLEGCLGSPWTTCAGWFGWLGSELLQNLRSAGFSANARKRYGNADAQRIKPRASIAARTILIGPLYGELLLGNTIQCCNKRLKKVFIMNLFSHFFNFTPIACYKPDLSFPAKSHNTKVRSEFF